MFTRASMIFALVIASNVMAGTPLQVMNIFLSVVAISLWSVMYFSFYSSNRKEDGREIDRNLWAFVTLVLAAGFFYAILGRFTYGQRIIDGIIGSVGLFKMLVIVFLYMYFKKAKDPLRTLENTILVFGWAFMLASYYILIVRGEILISVSSFDGSTDYLYKLSILGYFLILLCGFIYLTRCLKRFSILNIIVACLFWAVPLIANNSRQYLFYLSITIVYFIVRNRRVFHARRIIYAITGLGFVFLVSLCLYHDAVNQFIKQKAELGKDAFAVITSRVEYVEDSSALARAQEAELAFDSIVRYPCFGVGTIRPQNQIDYVGAYFYPNDLGIIGLLYNYGIVGVVFFSYIFVYVMRCFKYKQIDSVDPFIHSTNYCLLYFSISSITTGMFVYSISWFYFLLGISMFGIKLHHQTTIQGGIVDAGEWGYHD